MTVFRQLDLSYKIIFNPMVKLSDIFSKLLKSNKKAYHIVNIFSKIIVKIRKKRLLSQRIADNG